MISISVQDYMSKDPWINEAIQDIVALGLVKDFDEYIEAKGIKNSDQLEEFLCSTYDIFKEEFGIDSEVLELLLAYGIKARNKDELLTEEYFNSLDSDDKIIFIFAEAGIRSNESLIENKEAKLLLEKAIELIEENPLIYYRVDGKISDDETDLIGDPIRR